MYVLQSRASKRERERERKWHVNWHNKICKITQFNLFIFYFANLL